MTVSSLLICTGGASVTKYRLVDNSYGRFCPSAVGKHTLLELYFLLKIDWSVSFQNRLGLIAVDIGLLKWNTKWVVGSWSDKTTYKFNSELEKAYIFLCEIIICTSQANRNPNTICLLCFHIKSVMGIIFKWTSAKFLFYPDATFWVNDHSIYFYSEHCFIYLYLSNGDVWILVSQ